MHLVERYEHAGVEVCVFYDEDGPDPREADNLGEMYVSYRGHSLGDHQLPSDGLPDIPCPTCNGEAGASSEACEQCEGWGEVSPTLGEWLGSLKAIAAMPLFVYEHGMITIRGGRLVMLDEDKMAPNDTVSVNRFAGDAQGWDTSFVGFMIATEDRIKELCGEGPEYRRPDWLDSALKAELEEYDRFLRGEIYCYRVAEGTPFEDACAGFIGLEYAKEEAERAAEVAATQQHDEQIARAEWAARDVITLAVG